MLIRTAKYIRLAHGFCQHYLLVACRQSISSSSIAKCNTEETSNSGMLLFNNDTMFPVLLFARRQATPQHCFFNRGQWCRCAFSLRYGVCSHSYFLPGDRPHDLGYFIVPFLGSGQRCRCSFVLAMDYQIMLFPSTRYHQTSCK